MPVASHKSVLLERARRAREEAIDRAGHSRPSAPDWFPSIAWLRELGYTNAEIAGALSLSERWVREILLKGTVDGRSAVDIRPHAIPRDKLAPEFKAMLEDTPEAFELFYNHFNPKYPLPDHNKEWVKEYLENPRLQLNVPPRHNKSTIFSIWIPVWELCKNRNHRILIVSRTMTLAVNWVAYISFLLTSSEIPRVFGRFAPDKQSGDTPWRPSKGELMVLGRTEEAGAAQFSVLARGSEGQILGFEATRIIIDDLTDKTVAISETGREHEKNWLMESVMSRLQPGGRAVVIGQRVHINDIYGTLAEQEYTRGVKRGTKVWHTIVHPAVLKWPDAEDDNDAEVLWPDLWPFEELMERFASMGEQGFECMYQQNPLPSSYALVRSEWLNKCRDYNREAGPAGWGHDPDSQFIPMVRVFSIDPSPTKYNGLVVADVAITRDQFACVILECRSFQGDLRAVKSEIRRVVSAYHPAYFIFERNIAQHWLQGDPFFEELKGRVRVLPHDTYKNKGDAEYGMESLGADFEFGRIRLPAGDVRSREMSNTLEREALTWTREGRTRDDTLMALWFIKWNWRKLTPTHNLPTEMVDDDGNGGWGYLQDVNNIRRNYAARR
jgi:hypothetical protein